MKKKKNVKRAPEGTLKKIRRAMKSCQKKGIDIMNGDWGTELDPDQGKYVPESSDSPAVCAMGALLIDKNGGIKFDEFRGRRSLDSLEQNAVAAYVLGVDKSWVDNFIDGFDGGDPGWNHGYKAWGDSYLEYPNGEEGRFVKNVTPQQLENRRAFLMGRKLAEEFGVNQFGY